MSYKDNGGPAFPVAENYDDIRGEMRIYAHEGMTLRDYFAAKAMAGTHHGIAVCSPPHDYARIAEHCYRMADAMLKERAK